jgi:epoxyqueuosine reductase
LDITERIVEIGRSQFVDLIGFADLLPYRDEIVKLGGPIVSGYTYGISMGVRIPDSIVDFLPQRADHNVACEYRTHGYDILNRRLEHTASIVSSFLNQSGFRTLPIPAAERTDQENGVPTVSHKMVAHIAGLGWIGKNCLLVTPDYGPRLRLISLLTDAPVSGVNEPFGERCGDCDMCAAVCPVGAIKGRNYAHGEPREKRLDFRKCQEYFGQLAQTEKHPVCGMCLYACPVGQRDGRLTSHSGEGTAKEYGCRISASGFAAPTKADGEELFPIPMERGECEEG